MAFVLSSPDYMNAAVMRHEQVFSGMGQTGENLSPALAWSGAPEGVRSYVVTMYDPDAPTGSGWWHWVVINIPASVSSLPEGAGSGKGGLPEGAVQIRTDFGTRGYGGAAPPPGRVHRYVITVTAIDVPVLEIPEDSSPAVVGFMLGQHRLTEARLTLLYGTKG
ncbi:kinase inhibitor [Acetobacter sp. AN02]|uniref:kinase inhibitor n=1 Tax=Acetobacter sp. AN02 TaxID=2894186 RepID=UPI0024343F8B|nr:kinase inhibitor [Acetobacter sp. AN02]MDG6094228.1 kinase inhibitor [Acetobacter sp. AN02]